MSQDDMQQLFSAAKQAQVLRNEAVRIIMSDANPNVLRGTFIRVLLELQNSSEDYIVARVGGIATGEVYGGFSTSSSVRTDKYLLLVLPPHLASINGTQYQLNSISNSTMTEGEFTRWLEMMQPCLHMGAPFLGLDGCDPPVDYAVPSRAELHAVAEAVSAASGERRNAQRGRPRRASQVQSGRPPSLPGNGGLSARLSRQGTATALNQHTHGNPNANTNTNQLHAHHPPLFATPSPRPASASSTLASLPETAAMERELDLPTRRQIRQDIINKMNQRCVLFPHNVNELKVSQLRLTERDMIEYLEHVREAISNKQENCVVCMDHVPTVISLPCRHKVLCRLCASSVNTCPVCRSQLFELFEPKEI